MSMGRRSWLLRTLGTLIAAPIVAHEAVELKATQNCPSCGGVMTPGAPCPYCATVTPDDLQAVLQLHMRAGDRTWTIRRPVSICHPGDVVFEATELGMPHGGAILDGISIDLDVPGLGHKTLRLPTLTQRITSAADTLTVQVDPQWWVSFS